MGRCSQDEGSIEPGILSSDLAPAAPAAIHIWKHVHEVRVSCQVDAGLGRCVFRISSDRGSLITLTACHWQGVPADRRTRYPGLSIGGLFIKVGYRRRI